MQAYAGYGTLLLGEGYCTTVISSPDAKREIVFGGEISRDSAFRVAEARFGAAIAAGASRRARTALLNLALVGRARAQARSRGPLGRAERRTRVPPAFRYQMTASASSLRRQTGYGRRSARAS